MRIQPSYGSLSGKELHSFTYCPPNHSCLHELNGGVIKPIKDSLNMPLELREVKEDHEWNELIQCECESYEDPFNAFYILLRADRGNSE